MNEFTIAYLINGQSYSVLDDFTVSAEYNMTQGTLDVLISPPVGEDVDTAVLAINESGATLHATILYSTYGVECEISGVNGTSISVDLESNSISRQVFLSFAVTEFTVL